MVTWGYIPIEVILAQNIQNGAVRQKRHLLSIESAKKSWWQNCILWAFLTQCEYQLDEGLVNIVTCSFLSFSPKQ